MRRSRHTGTKRLIPRPSDLSYFNWATLTTSHNHSANFQACTLLLWSCYSTRLEPCSPCFSGPGSLRVRHGGYFCRELRRECLTCDDAGWANIKLDKNLAQVKPDNVQGLLLKHKRDRKIINVDPNAATGDNNRRVPILCPGADYMHVVLFDHEARRRS